MELWLLGLNNMNKIEVKIDTIFFEQILSGDKSFDVRLGDIKIEKGDVLVLLEKNPTTNKLTGRQIEKTVTLVRNTKDINHWPKEEVEKYGLQIIAFK